MRKYTYMALDSNANPTVKITVNVSRDGDVITAAAGKLALSVSAAITPEKCAEKVREAQGHRAHIVGVDEVGCIETRSLASKREEAIFWALGQFLAA